MSRSGYTDECDGWELIRWRGAVNSAIKGKRGQQFLIEMRNAMDALPEKRLIANELEHAGAYCAIGTVGALRGVDMSNIDPEDRLHVAEVFDIAPALAAEIVFMNDEYYFGREESPENRWHRMRKWIDDQILPPTPAVGEA